MTKMTKKAKKNDLADHKAQLRKTIRQTLREIAPPQRSAWSRQITARVLELPEYGRAKAIMVYLSFVTEFQTGDLIDAAIRADKIVCAPKMDWAAWRMYPAVLADKDDCRTGRSGVKEPTSDQAFPTEQLDLVLVPGLVFDLRGWRLGRGGGFYDRFFSRADLHACTAAAAFDCQIVEELVVDPHDQPVDLIVTPTALMRFTSRHVR